MDALVLDTADVQPGETMSSAPIEEYRRLSQEGYALPSVTLVREGGAILGVADGFPHVGGGRGRNALRRSPPR
jgi:hypothetical protein